jgi:predicted AAA+ superfamily ATPase
VAASAPRFPRYLTPRLREALATAAKADPVGFVSDLPARTILDEVQRVPEIFTSLKAAIERRRAAGRFILTGSANVLLVPTLADSLAGRMAMLRLHPLAQCEIEGRRPRFIETLFRAVFKTGIACALLGIDAARLVSDRQMLGALLETFVFQELRRQASWLPEPVGFFHFRDRDDFEVDIVLEQGALAVAGVEVKAAATVHESDLRGLRKLREAAGKRFAAGVVLYDGSASIAFGEGLFAVPVRRLWETP